LNAVAWTAIAATAWAADPAAPTAKPAAPAAQPAATPAAQAVPTKAELEKQFAEMLSGATMVGRFTEHQQGDDQPFKEDRYTLGKVAKIKDDTWLFETRIQYGDHDVTVPLPLEVKWAGDTPVISLTDMNVPGLGVFTARVVVYRNQYAGTWSGRDHGGQLFGKIVRDPDAGKEKPAASKTDALKSKSPYKK
jgi:hypothetical protein